MKKLVLISFILITATITGCKYNDSELWETIDDIDDRLTSLEQKVKEANENLSAVESILSAERNNLTIKSVSGTEKDGYTITLSDGSVISIKNGSDVPDISVKKDTDGVYYWTLGGEWILADGKKICAYESVPKVRINSTTKVWEISSDNGETWTSTGVVAEGRNDSLFESIDTSSEDYILFTLSDGTQFKVPRYDALPSVIIEDCDTNIAQRVTFGTTEIIRIKTSNVSGSFIQKPDGWKVSMTDSTISVTAPAKENTYAETEGDITINAVSTSGRSSFTSFKVQAIDYRLYTLTFEDPDTKFSPYTITGCGKEIKTWSDLIDSPQYGGPLLYNDYSVTGYKWYDTGNTMLSSSHDDGPYYYGGNAISNYFQSDLTKVDYTLQLSVSTGENGKAGHNGSSNFCIQSIDCSNISTQESSFIRFGDSEERIVDHMYVVNTSYLLSTLIYGNAFCSKAGKDSWVKIIVTGYNLSGDITATTEFFLLSENENYITEWTYFDLSSLGKVYKIGFTLSASSDFYGDYGLNLPSYFAYDDVTVRF